MQVTGEAPPSAPVSSSGVTVPEFLKARKPSSKGPVLCLVKMLDGQTMQLYAEPNTTGQQFLDQSELIYGGKFEKFLIGKRAVKERR